MTPTKNTPTQPLSGAPTKKRPYQAPVIQHSEAFERLALACSGTQSRARKDPLTACTGQAGT